MSALSKVPAFDAIRREDKGGEFWSARDLMEPLGYERWERFEDSIERAHAAAFNSGAVAADHFRGAAKMVQIGSGAARSIADYRLSRYGAYLVAMNGDPRKPEIAAAQTYFAVRTREAELAASAFTAPKSLAEALALALHLEQSREAAEAAQRVAEQQVAALAPRAAVADALIDTTGDYSLREAAQVLARDHGIDTGQNRLAKYLRKIGWTDPYGQPYQRHIACGRLVRRADTYKHPKTGERVPTTQLRITAKGLTELHALMTTPTAAPLALVSA